MTVWLLCVTKFIKLVEHKLLLLLPVAQQPLVGLVFLIIEALRSHSDTPHSVGLLWTSDRPVAEQHTPLKGTNVHAPRWVSNP